MSFNLKILCAVLLIGIIIVTLLAQYPESKEATLIESVSSAEVLIQATGIYRSPEKSERKAQKDVDENGVTEAIKDAKKAAVYFLLFGGTDPILRTAEERQKFDRYAETYFNLDQISHYIAWEQSLLQKKIKLENGTVLKIVKDLKINKEVLTRDLESDGIISSREELTQAFGNPFIMVIPETARNENPIDFLQTNAEAKHAASVIESYLTARKYDVVVPDQQARLNELSDAQFMLGGQETDYAHQLALSIGSDVYITFAGKSETSGYGTQKYSIMARAYESTTGRLLGTETGYSQARQGEVLVSVEEAMNDAIDKVLSRINSYWVDDLNRGIQYKVFVRISPEFDAEMLEEIQFAFADAVDEISKNAKENIVTDQTLDYIIWCDPAKFSRSSNVYRSLKKAFEDQGLDATIKRVNINRKLLTLSIESI
jgi:hypothetical protein